MAEQTLEQLKQKYDSVLSLIQQSGVRLAHVHIQGGKLFVQGEAPSDDVKNKIWDAIKRVDPKYPDLTLDLTVNSSAGIPAKPDANSGASGAAGSAAGGMLQNYIVQPGDSLSTISQNIYGSPGQYMKIFEANRDQLSDPNKIKTGQVLKIPK